MDRSQSTCPELHFIKLNGPFLNINFSLLYFSSRIFNSLSDSLIDALIH